MVQEYLAANLLTLGLGGHSIALAACRAGYIRCWKHNAYWLFDSPEIIRTIAREHSIQLEGTALFYYEADGKEFDGER